MSAKRCAIIILASGLSKRFGRENKLLAPLAGRAVIDHALEHIMPVGFGLHVAVIAALDDEGALLQAKLVKAGYKIIINPTPQSGQGGSLALGVQAVIAAGFERACIALADMPFVPSEHYAALVRLSANSSQIATQAQIDGELVTLPPCMFSGQALARLTQASGEKGAKSYMKHKDVLYQRLSVWSAHDIDSHEDLHRAEHDLRLLKSHKERLKTHADKR